MKLEISDQRSFSFFDKNIATKYCKEFDNLLWFKFAELFGTECIEGEKYICSKPFIYAINYSPYYFITKNQFKINKNKLLSNKKNKNTSKFDILKILGKKNKLLTLKPLSSTFFDKYELYKFLNIDFKNSDILILVNSTYSFVDIEVLSYLTKNNSFNIDINIYYFINYISSDYYNDYQSEKYNKFKKYINNLNIIYNSINKSIINQNKKYNIIYGRIKNPNNLTPNFEELNNINLKYFSFLVGIKNLKKGGKFIIDIGLINKKISCDIILIFSKFFNSYDFFIPEIKSNISMSGPSIIFNDFKDNITDIQYNNLIEIFNKFLEINPSSTNFNIFNKKIRNRYNIWKPIKFNNTDKFPMSLMNKPDTDKIYDVFREFNKNYYIKGITSINKLIKYVNNYGIDINKVPSNIRNIQLENSIMYAKKFHFNTIKINEVDYKQITFNLNEKIFSIYNYHEIKMNKKNTSFNLINAYQNYDYKLYDLITSIDQLNNIAIYHSSCNIFYPGYMEYKLIDYINKKMNLNINYKIYTNWIDLYEILKIFNIKYSKSLHLCTNYGESINVINYYESQQKKRRKSNKLHSSLNNKLNRKYDLFIGNCNNIKNLNTINFSYFMKGHKLYQIKFNYINKHNIITLYYEKGAFYFESKKMANILNYNRNKNFINRNSNEHQLNLHVNKNIDIMHSHIKILEKDEKAFLTRLFKYAKIPLDNITNILKAKDVFKNNSNKTFIEFNGGNYAENILEKINKVPIDKISKFSYKSVYINNGIQMLENLEKGGTGIIKMSLPLKYLSEFDLLFIIYKSFENITFYNPSNITNITEYYIICSNYKILPNKNNFKDLLKIKSVINNEYLKKYNTSFLDKLRYSFCELYNVYNNIIEQLSYLLNFQEEIIDNNESIQKIILDYNKKWITEFMP